MAVFKWRIKDPPGTNTRGGELRLTSSVRHLLILQDITLWAKILCAKHCAGSWVHRISQIPSLVHKETRWKHTGYEHRGLVKHHTGHLAHSLGKGDQRSLPGGRNAQLGFKGLLLLAWPAPLAELVFSATASQWFASSFLSAPSSSHRLCCYSCGNSFILTQKINKNKKESGRPSEFGKLLYSVKLYLRLCVSWRSQKFNLGLLLVSSHLLLGAHTEGFCLLLEMAVVVVCVCV